MRDGQIAVRTVRLRPRLSIDNKRRWVWTTTNYDYYITITTTTITTVPLSQDSSHVSRAVVPRYACSVQQTGWLQHKQHPASHRSTFLLALTLCAASSLHLSHQSLSISLSLFHTLSSSQPSSLSSDRKTSLSLPFQLLHTNHRPQPLLPATINGPPHLTTATAGLPPCL